MIDYETKRKIIAEFKRCIYYIVQVIERQSAKEDNIQVLLASNNLT